MARKREVGEWYANPHVNGWWAVNYEGSPYGIDGYCGPVHAWVAKAIVTEGNRRNDARKAKRRKRGK